MSAHKKTLFIKTRPEITPLLIEIINKEKKVIIASCSRYIQWVLKKSSIESVLIEAYAQSKGCAALHKELSSRYDRLCKAADAEIDYADLFKNHLCWETQREFFFLSACWSMISMHCIDRIYFEYFAQTPSVRYSPSLNELCIKFFRRRNITIISLLNKK
jgi:hypothetical protein